MSNVDKKVETSVGPQDATTSLRQENGYPNVETALIETKMTYDMVDKIFASPFANKDLYVKNDECYKLVESLVNMVQPAKPRFEGEILPRWDGLYIPVKYEQKGSGCLPVWIYKFTQGKYREGYMISLGHNAGTVNVMQEVNAMPKGAIDWDDKLLEDIDGFKAVVEEIIRFIPCLGKADEVRTKVPYEFQTGEIKRKFVLDDEDLKKLMLPEEAKRIGAEYARHLERFSPVKKLNLFGFELGVFSNGRIMPSSKITLKKYLETMAMCYDVVFGKEEGTPKERYKKHSYLHGYGVDMTDYISNPNNKREFRKLIESDRLRGSYPFEVDYGLSLFPPGSAYHNDGFYYLSSHRGGDEEKFIKLIEALIRHKVAFKTNDLESALDHLTGEEKVRVNNGYYNYEELKEKGILKEIKWEKLEVAKPKLPLSLVNGTASI